MNLLIAPPPLFCIRFHFGIVLLCCSLSAQGQNHNHLAAVWNSSLAPAVKLDSMSRMLHKTLSSDSLETYANQVLLLSQQIQTPKQQAILLNRLAKLAEKDHQNLSLAETYYRQALDLRRQTGNVPWTAFLAAKLGDMTYAQGRRLASIELYREAISLYQEKKDLENLGKASYHQGMNFQKLWMLDSAIYHFTKALEVKSKLSDTLGMIKVYHELAQTYRDDDGLQQAQYFLDSAKNLINRHEFSDSNLKADNHLLQSSVLHQTHKYDAAIGNINEAISLYKQLYDEVNMAKALNSLGKIYLQLGIFHESALALKTAESLISDSESSDISEMMNRQLTDTSIVSSDLLATIYRNLSDTYRYQHKYEQAILYANKSQAAYQVYKSRSMGEGDFIAKLEYQFLVENNNSLAESKALFSLIQRQQRQFALALALAFIIICLSLWGFWQAKINHRKTKQVLSLNQELHNQKILHIVKDREDEIATAFIEGQDKEREHIAAELHDNLAGSIAAGKNLVGMLPSADESNPSNKLHSKVIQILDSVYQHTRLLSHQLTHSTQQYSFGDLSREVEDLLENLRMLNIEVDLQIKGDTKDQINTLSAFHLKRIVQEAITNIIKYAKASYVYIYLDWHSDYLNMTIEDDGIGFDPENTQEGIGIQNMTMRVKRLHGDIQTYSSPKNGTRIELKIPKNMMEFAYH